MKKSTEFISNKKFEQKLKAKIEEIKVGMGMTGHGSSEIRNNLNLSTSLRTSSVNDALMSSDDMEIDFSYTDTESESECDFTQGEELSDDCEDDLQSQNDFELSEIPEFNELEFNVFEYIKSLDFLLRKWAVKHNIKLLALSELLKILKVKGHNSLPKDARTLLKIPKKIETVEMGSGEYWHGGLRTKLTEIYKKNDLGDVLQLNIHIDGTPIYKISKSEFWPIQCDVNGVEMKPFFVAIYQGQSKPPSAEQFLRQFLDEIHELSEIGITASASSGATKTFRIKIDKFILDAPARAFLKCTIGHSGYSSCERCEERGEYLCKISKRAKGVKGSNKGHVCLIGINAPLRTDESFRSKEDEDHHHDTSPLEELQIDMVRDIPLEYLHLILYGAMKRLLMLWIDGTKHFKLSEKDVLEISNKHRNANKTMPSEINKPNRSLKCLSFWKATEYRTFLLKTGPVVLRGHLTEEMYNHFLALHCAVTICSSESLNRYVPVAKQLYRTFSEKFGELYGDENRTYSTHSVIHVTDDVDRFGVLDTYSAFPGENNLVFLKSLVRGGHLPLQQVVRRIAERNSCEKICEFENCQDQPEGLHKGIFRTKGLRLDGTEKNQWILTKNMDIFQIISITENKKMVQLHGNLLVKRNQQNLSDKPFASKKMRIFKSKLESTPFSINLEDMFCKLYRVKMSVEFSAFFPLYHHTQNV